MGYKTYEFDHNGRITVYPSIERSSRKGPGRFVLLIRKLLAHKSTLGKSRF